MRLMQAARLDLSPRHRQPSLVRVALATLASLALSLGVDAAAVRLGTTIFPTTRGYGHFHFSDYATLTVIGVLVACAAWPIVTRATSRPRWLFFRLAVVVTLALWVPDLWILASGQPPRAVGILMVMHLGIALVTYNLLVRAAPVGPQARGSDAGVEGGASDLVLTERAVLVVWTTMAILVAVELMLGVAAIVSVPFGRRPTLVPTNGTVEYLAHGSLGIVLALGAVVVLVMSTAAGRLARIGAVMGAAGVACGLAGGVMASIEVTRVLGMSLMMLGVVVAGVGYLVPALEAFGKAEASRAAAARAAARTARMAEVSASAHGATGSAFDPDHPPIGAVPSERVSTNGHGGHGGHGAGSEGPGERP